MLPMHALHGAIDTAASVELKSGDCFNGYIVSADYFMNLKLRDVTITDSSGENFSHVDQCFLRGNNIKYIRISEEAIEKATEEKKSSNKRGRTISRGKPRNKS